MAAMGTTLGNGFQSTLPRGERLVKPCCLKYPFNFNPRSREGSDAEKRRGNCMAKVNFNPRSREGSDGRNHGNAELVTGFQSTLPRGERHGLFSICNIITVFQCTLPRGERLAQLVYLVDGVHYFNPRSREGSDVLS